ncbi:GPN-loop GTPase [Pancytospora epiphaga]|nr:GPN-loop GTPase [Pancytospora epiphaga]
MDTQCFVVIGMAGSGKTTFCQRLYSWLCTDIVLENGLNSLITSINLDPAVYNPKMPLTIDIRDTVDFEEIMKKYKLGPNGCINTCLNIFMLNFEKPKTTRFSIVDTPGQIEAFTWSAPGDALMSMLDGVTILYIVDMSLCKDMRVFVYNMLFAASLKIRFKRPLLVVFNKCDLEEVKEVESWLRDFNTCLQSIDPEDCELRSAVLYFEEFYKELDFVCVSSFTGAGKGEFMKAIEKIKESRTSDDINKHP